ncbi:hypothetical protein KKI23_01940, partial [Patescibacteria group bacterium]|nr:hypothetical protein [Patescibacteria group bacterium]
MNPSYQDDIIRYPLNAETKKLIGQFQEWQKARNPKIDTATIHVDEVASTVARFYEKIRMVVDWKEEHLIRRIATQRILKRRMIMKYSKPEELAEAFIKELIRGGHFPNDTIPKSKITRVQKVINKYNYILKNCPPPPLHKNRSQFFTQMVEIAACEIEAVLDPATYMRADAMIEYMETIISRRIKIGSKATAKTGITEQTKKIQIFIAVQQSLLRLDKPIVTYNLIKRYYDNWSFLPDDQLEVVAQNIHHLMGNIEKHLKYVLSDKFYKLCKQYNTSYLLMGDILSKNIEDAEEKISYPQLLKELIKKSYNVRLKSLKTRVRRAAVYSTISIFMTNAFSLYLLEIPIALYFIGQFNKTAMVVDIMGPTLLMAFLVLTIRLPQPKNFLLVFAEVKKNVYQQENHDFYEIELYPKRSFVFKIISGILYLVSFLAVFGIIIWVFWSVDFPPFSYVINIIFTSLIAFAGTLIRQRARELQVTEERGNFFHIF